MTVWLDPRDGRPTVRFAFLVPAACRWELVFASLICRPPRVGYPLTPALDGMLTPYFEFRPRRCAGHPPWPERELAIDIDATEWWPKQKRFMMLDDVGTVIGVLDTDGSRREVRADQPEECLIRFSGAFRSGT